MSINTAWKMLLDKYDILNEVEKNGKFIIKAKQIKEYKEPRLMAKWDSSTSLPSNLKNNNLNILPISRSEYVIGKFELYECIPVLNESVTKMQNVEFNEYETIDINNITSESIAINVLQISGILSDFLASNEYIPTFNGRMGTGTFDFSVNTNPTGKENISVNNAQCEIDGGFENEYSIVILEAKNVVYEDFHIRQLYYPYRLWRNKVTKPIRLVFSIYSNMIYRLFEYEFTSPDDYSSIKLINQKNYSLQDTKISIEELKELIKDIKKIKKDEKNGKIPFIQANSFERVISLLEHLSVTPMTKIQIAELMDFDIRQSDYYFNAGKYLGIFEKIKKDKKTLIQLSTLGRSIYNLNYKQRQLKLVKLILKHEIFNYFFSTVIAEGKLPKKDDILNKMKELNVCPENTITRRASSVEAWLNWIFNLPNL